jgi:hypothetical protein
VGKGVLNKPFGLISGGRVKLLAVDAQLERELILPQLLRFRTCN